jgi:hypothetical protein
LAQAPFNFDANNNLHIIVQQKISFVFVHILKKRLKSEIAERKKAVTKANQKKANFEQIKREMEESIHKISENFHEQIDEILNNCSIAQMRLATNARWKEIIDQFIVQFIASDEVAENINNPTPPSPPLVSSVNSTPTANSQNSLTMINNSHNNIALNSNNNSSFNNCNNISFNHVFSFNNSDVDNNDNIFAPDENLGEYVESLLTMNDPNYQKKT